MACGYARAGRYEFCALAGEGQNEMPESAARSFARDPHVYRASSF